MMLLPFQALLVLLPLKALLSPFLVVSESISTQKFVLYSEQDTLLHLTDNNRNFGEAFTTKKSAEIPINILKHNTSYKISGHVIFNEVGNCTIKQNRSIEGKIDNFLFEISVLQQLVRHLHY